MTNIPMNGRWVRLMVPGPSNHQKPYDVSKNILTISINLEVLNSEDASDSRCALGVS